MSRAKSRPGNLATDASMVPAVFYSEKTARTINEIIDTWPERVARGQELVVAHAATVVRDELKRVAPKVDGYDYAKKLEVVELGGTSEWPIQFAIVHPEIAEKPMDETEKDRTLLYVQPKRRAPEWVFTLRDYGPWPPALMPASVPPKFGRVIAKSSSQRDMQKARQNIQKNRLTIEREMKRAGFKNVDLTEEKADVATDPVVADLASSVLDVELGRGESRRAHWKPVLRTFQQSLALLATKYVRYIETGNEGLFRNGVDGRMSNSEFAGTTPFSDAIARAAGIS